MTEAAAKSSLSMRRRGDVVEILKFHDPAVVLEGDDAVTLYDHWIALPAETRHLYVEGLLHMQAVRMRTAPIERAFLRETGDADDCDRELVVIVGRETKTVRLGHERIAGWAADLVLALRDQVRASRRSDGALSPRSSGAQPALAALADPPGRASGTPEDRLCLRSSGADPDSSDDRPKGGKADRPPPGQGAPAQARAQRGSAASETNRPKGGE